MSSFSYLRAMWPADDRDNARRQAALRNDRHASRLLAHNRHRFRKVVQLSRNADILGHVEIVDATSIAALASGMDVKYGAALMTAKNFLPSNGHSMWSAAITS